MNGFSSVAQGCHLAKRCVGCVVGTIGLLAILVMVWPAPAAGADLNLQILYDLKSNPKNPRADLVQGSDGNFYGTTAFGGASGENGTVFAITSTGFFAVLHSFQGSDGALPWAGLVQGRDGLFYGTALGGGTNGDFGTIFQMATNGDFTVLHHFGGSDGRSPQAALRQGTDGEFYGTTAFGGTNGDQGTVNSHGQTWTVQLEWSNSHDACIAGPASTDFALVVTPGNHAIAAGSTQG